MKTRPANGLDDTRTADPRGSSVLEAARRLSLGGEWARAAELYARGGAELKAAESWERAKEYTRAAEIYERLYVDSLVKGASADKGAALRGGRLYAKGAQPDRALDLLARGGHLAEAAGLAESLGRFAEAAELHTRAAALVRAAECWERAGDKVRAALTRGEAELVADRPSEAARHFLEGQDHCRAAEIYETLGTPARAAAAYEQGGAWSEAGEAYLRAGDRPAAAAAFEKGQKFARAAELFEQLGERARAAALHERAGNFFKSGQAAARAGDVKQAIALLQRVALDDPRHLEATDLLAQLFLRSGMPRLGVERLQLALRDALPERATLSPHYWLAMCWEALGETRWALDRYQKILAVDFGFRDTSERSQRLASGRPATPITLRPVSPVPAPPPVVPVVPAAAPAAQAPKPPTPPPAAPARAPLLVRETLGGGPLGVVQRAEQNDGRAVAVRVLATDKVTPEVLPPLLGDLAPAARLSHPNLVKVIGVTELNGRACVLAELVKGTNMADFLRSGQRLSLKRCHALGRALALVLSYIHGKQLVHGSVRPSNLMVVGGVLKLADLGLGPLFRVIVAPDAYRAPENHLDVAGDVFAYGATLYHLLTGAVPPPTSVPAPSALVDGVPASFDQLLLRALDPDPAARFPSAKALVQALDAMVTIG